MKKVFTDANEVWRRMGRVVLGLALTAYLLVFIDWLQNPRLTQMELFLANWQCILFVIGAALLARRMIR